MTRQIMATEKKTAITLEPAKDTCSNLMASWIEFAKQRGEDPGSSKSFGTRMRRLGFQPAWVDKPPTRGKGYLGICVTTYEHLRQRQNVSGT